METHAHSLYFEVAAVVTTFPLLGRHLGAKANQRTGDALKALLNLGAKEATALRDGVESLIAADRLQPGDGFLVRPGEQIATVASSPTVTPPSTPAHHGEVAAGGSRYWARKGRF